MVSKNRFEPSTRFEWKVAKGGYHWIKTKKGRVLCAVDASKPDWLDIFDAYRNTYRPLEERTGLFRTFAELQPTERQVCEFADRFGMLLEGDNLQLDSSHGPVSIHAEQLQTWKENIIQLRRMVKLWDLVRSGDRKALVKLAEQSVDHTLPLAVQNRFHLNDANPAMPVLSTIQRTTDKALREHIHTTLLFNGDEPRLKVFLEPQDLLGALWLQFAAAVDSRKTFTQCAFCGESFEVSRDPAGKRRNARFCSDRCRVAHYRARIDRARQLKSEDTPLREIARELNTSVSTVRNWLTSEDRVDVKN